MYDFSKIINWKLLEGSHDFPGPDGGTCINEAAIVAAGFEYKKVGSAKDCPPCFSRPIAAYAIRLNDGMPDDLRQELLMPFVTRLSGTADSQAIEIRRAQFMALENCRRIMPMFCVDVIKRPDFAERCKNAGDLKEAEMICKEIRKAYADAADAADAAGAAGAAYAGAYAGAYAAAAGAAYAADAAGAAYAAAAGAADAADAGAYAVKRKYFTVATQILDEAILMGKHPTDIDIALVNHRLETAKRMITA